MKKHKQNIGQLRYPIYDYIAGQFEKQIDYHLRYGIWDSISTQIRIELSRQLCHNTFLQLKEYEEA